MKRKRILIGHDRRYTFKLYPNAEQERLFHEQCRMIAALWNALIQRCEDTYRTTRGQKNVVHRDGKAMPSFFDMTAEITELRQACPEWAALSVWSAHRVADALTKAFEAFFRRANQGAGAQSGYPRYRSARNAAWLPHRFASGCKLAPRAGEGSGNGREPASARNWSLTLKGVPGSIRARGEFPAPVLNWADADIRHLNQHWWLSVGVEMPKRREPGSRETTIHFDLIDQFARIEGSEILPPLDAYLAQTAALNERADAIKSERDRRFKKGSWRWRQATQAAASKTAKASRIRRERLHEWTTAIAGNASGMTVIAPKTRSETQSPRGNEHQWGAGVEAVSALNRSTLNQAPATARAMLQYKADEAGIRCDVIVDETPAIGIGSHMVESGQKFRRAARKARKEAEHANP